MAPKKSAPPAKKTAAPASHASYKDMIKEAILNLKERNGSSRQAIKKYIQANNKITATPAAFDSLFNRNLKAGVTAGDFTQPKGTSGPVKLAKKEPASKPSAPKAAAPKSTSTTKAAPKKSSTTKKAPAPAKAAPAPKKASAKPKANASKPRKASTVAPAVTEKPTILSKTKSGRVTKTTAPPTKPAAKKATTKKAATKKATPKKKAAESTAA
ncbi:MAG: hypothetical protein M1813_005807 [Trichoglossum hirsutum]|nr:MAG: hypothetical protein M1813_005807 [Trichoglossum hirsutum]